MARDAALTLWMTLRQEVLGDAGALHHTLKSLSAHVVTALDVTGAGVLIASGGQRQAVLGASDGRMHRLEQLQTTFDEGPCMDAYRSGRFAAALDIVGFDAARWPSFGPAAVSAGIHAAFSFPLAVGDIALGALDCYRARAGALTPTQIRLGGLFAHIAADLVLHAQTGSDVDTVVSSMVQRDGAHDRVEQARGMVAYRLAVSMTRSLQLMRAHARRSEQSLDEVAGLIVDGRLELTA